MHMEQRKHATIPRDIRFCGHAWPEMCLGSLNLVLPVRLVPGRALILGRHSRLENIANIILRTHTDAILFRVALTGSPEHKKLHGVWLNILWLRPHFRSPGDLRDLTDLSFALWHVIFCTISCRYQGQSPSHQSCMRPIDSSVTSPLASWQMYSRSLRNGSRILL